MKTHSQIGLGTAAIGRPQYININHNKNSNTNLSDFKATGLALLSTAYHLGIRYFDTAPGYGMAENLLMQWVDQQGYNDIQVASKWGYTYTANFDPHATTHEVKEHSLSKLNEQWEVTKTLVPHLKVYQIHSATFESGVLENTSVLNRLVELKKEQQITIGLTTTGPNQLEVLKRALNIHIDGEQLFDLAQVTYNIFEQCLGDFLNSLRESDIQIVIKEALANGRVFPNPHYPNYNNTYSILSKLAHKYQVGIDAIALRFCIDSITSFKVLSGASTEDQLNSNLKAESFKLSMDDSEALKKVAVDSTHYWTERKQLAWN